MQIELERCSLRDWRHGDEEALQRNADNINVSRYLVDAFPHPYTLEHARDWIGRHAGADPQTQFAIVIDGAPAGGVGFALGKDIWRRSAEIGYWLAEPYWGRGVVTDAVRAACRYAFETFDLMHIFAGLFEPNIASRRVLEKAGFVLEGRLRQHVTKLDVTMDDLIFGLVNESRVAQQSRRTSNTS